MNRFIRAFLFLAIFFGGFYLEKLTEQKPDTLYSEVREGGKKFSYVNKLLECEIASEYISSTKVRPSESKINELIDDQIQKEAVTFASVYYRDLNNGPWIGINERERFSPASLMKVPLSISIYRLAHTKPEILNDKLIINELPIDLNAPQNYEQKEAVRVGDEYTVEELIKRSIQLSDNKAAVTLFNRYPNAVGGILSDLHIFKPINADSDYITVKDYASFFRILFNASYLDMYESEHLLDYLAHTNFDEGLTKYLPKKIKVAHKFGERSHESQKVIDQLHDCGIVYYPEHPYLLCIMTRGKEVHKMAEAIAQISKLVYKEVENNIK